MWIVFPSTGLRQLELWSRIRLRVYSPAGVTSASVLDISHVRLMCGM